MSRGPFVPCAARACLGVAAMAAALSACSADALEPVEPTLTTPGAFVAREELASFVIYRTLSTLQLENDLVLMLERYQPRAHSFEEAGELARQPGLPLAQPLEYIPESVFVVTPWSVVWFRSPTREELARVY